MNQSQDPVPTEGAAVAELLDLLVIGAGPCGLGVGIAAAEAALSCLIVDKGCVASAIAGYPTYMTFFSTAERLEIGGVPFIISGVKPTRREALRYYQRLVPHFGLRVRQYERVESVHAADGSFRVDTLTKAGRSRALRARNVVFATGYFDHPNMLHVPGEELPHVAHSYREGSPYFDQDVVVVGGGNSAVDAALELYHWGARVTLVHFAPTLDPNVKPWVLPDISNRLKNGEIQARWSSRIVEIHPTSVILQHQESGAREEVHSDWVLAMTGYTPDPGMLRDLGVRFDPTSGIPEHDPTTMETNQPGIFIAGVLAAGNNANMVFIENGRDHGKRIVSRLQNTRKP